MDCTANTILVVDDNAITARWVGYVASTLGFNPVLAFDGEEALSRLSEQSFVLVISDVEMPRMDGFDLLQNIRALYPQMPVILMSAHCNEERRRAASACGAQAFLESRSMRINSTSCLGATSLRESTTPSGTFRPFRSFTESKP